MLDQGTALDMCLVILVWRQRENWTERLSVGWGTKYFGHVCKLDQDTALDLCLVILVCRQTEIRT